MANQKGILHIDLDRVEEQKQNLDTGSDLSPASDKTSPYSLPDLSSADQPVTWLSSSHPEFRRKMIRVSPKKSRVIQIGDDGIDETIIISRKNESKKMNEGDKLRRPRSQSDIKTLGKTQSFETLPSLQRINLKEHIDKMSADLSIKEVVKHIIESKLKLKNVNIDGFVKIFENNLIMNLGILCSLDPDAIDKLNLPLALESEIKNLIKKKKKPKIFSYAEVTLEMRNDLHKILTMIVKNSYYRHILFSKFYDQWYSQDMKAQEIVNTGNIDLKSRKLFGTINILADFLINGRAIVEKNEKLIVTHLILKINSFDIYFETLVNVIQEILDGQMDDVMKDALLLASCELGNTIKKHYDFIKRGKKYCIYYNKNKKWHKCYCSITHEEVMIKRYPANIEHHQIKIVNIDKIEMVDEGDERITKQTDHCIRLVLKNGEISYICTDNELYIQTIFEDLQTRINAFALL